MPSIPLTSCGIMNGTCMCLDNTFQALASECLSQKCSPVDILSTSLDPPPKAIQVLGSLVFLTFP